MDHSRKYFTVFAAVLIIFFILLEITNQNNIQKISWMWAVILPIFVIFYLFTYFVRRLQSWQLPISSGLVLLLGLYLLNTSRFPSYTTKLSQTWDMNTASLGIALIALAFVFAPLLLGERTAPQNLRPTDPQDEISRLTAEIESLNNRLIILKRATVKLNSTLNDPPHIP